MAGTLTGGKAAARTNKERHGEDYYVRLGRIGGRNSTGGGFTHNRELASAAGRIGGTISRRKGVLRKYWYERKPVDQRAVDLAYKHLLQVQRKAQHDREVAE